MGKAKKRTKQKPSKTTLLKKPLTPVYTEFETICNEVNITFEKMKRLQKFHQKPLTDFTHNLISYSVPYSQEKELWVDYLRGGSVNEGFLYDQLSLDFDQLIILLVEVSDQLVNDKMFHYLAAYAFAFEEKGKLYESKFLAILASRFFELDGVLNAYHKMKHYIFIHKLFEGDFTTRIIYTCKIIEVLEVKHPDHEVCKLQKNVQKEHLVGFLTFLSASKRSLTPIHYNIEEDQIIIFINILSQHLPDLLDDILPKLIQKKSISSPIKHNTTLSLLSNDSHIPSISSEEDDASNLLDGIVCLIDLFLPLSLKHESSLLSLCLSLVTNGDTLIAFIQTFAQSLLLIFSKVDGLFHDKNVILNKSLEDFLSRVNPKKRFTKHNLFARLKHHIEQTQSLTEEDLAQVSNLGDNLDHLKTQLNIRYFETLAKYELELISIRESIKDHLSKPSHLTKTSSLEKTALLKIIAQFDVVREKGAILLPLYTELNLWLVSRPSEIKHTEIISENPEAKNPKRKTIKRNNNLQLKAAEKKSLQRNIIDSTETVKHTNSAVTITALSVRLEPSVLAFKQYPDLQIKQQQIFNLLILSNNKNLKTAYRHLDEADRLNRVFFSALEQDSQHLAFAYALVTQIDILYGLYRVNNNAKGLEDADAHELFINQQKLINTLEDVYYKLTEHVSLLVPIDSTEALIINDLNVQTELANSVLIQLQTEIKKKQNFYQTTVKSEPQVVSNPLTPKSGLMPVTNSALASLSTLTRIKKIKTRPQESSAEPKTWDTPPSVSMLSLINPQEFPKLGLTNSPIKDSKVKNSSHRLFKPTRSRKKRLNKMQFMQKAQSLFPSDWIVNCYDYQMLDYWYPVVTDIIKAKQYLTFKEKNGIIDLHIIRSAHPHNGSVFTYISNLPIIINPCFTVAHHVISSTQQGFHFECENEKTKQLLRQLVDQVLYECGENPGLSVPTCNLLIM